MDLNLDGEERFNVFVFGDTFADRKTFIKTAVMGHKSSLNDSMWKQIVVHDDVEVCSVLLNEPTDEKQTICEVWNFSDKKMSQGIAQMFLTPFSLVIVLAESQQDQDKLSKLWTNFAMKGVSHVIVIGSKQSSSTGLTDGGMIKTFQTLDEAMEQYIQDHSPSDVSKKKMAEPRQYHEPGKDQDLKPFITEIYTKSKQKVDIEINFERQIQHHIVTLRKQNIVFCEIKDLWESVTLETADKSKILNNFVQEDTITRFWTDENKELICVNPIQFLKLIYAIHVDSCNKTFCISPSKFWPSKVKDRPDKVLLEKVIEDIPMKGLIRQSLMPLMWQNLLENKEQVILVSSQLERLGLLMRYKKMSMYSDVLCLYDYPQLSSVEQLSLVLMGKLSNSKPSLNWYDELQPSDIQLHFTVMFPHGSPTGCLERYLGAVHCVYKYLLNYHYGWSSGLLLRVNDVFIYFITTDDLLEIFVRTDEDIYSDEDEALRHLWITVGPAFNCFIVYIANWSGLIYKINLIATGEIFKMKPLFQSRDIKELLADQYIRTDGKDDGCTPNSKKIFPFDDFEAKDEYTILKDWIEFIMKQTEEELKPETIESKPCLTERLSIKPEKQARKNSKRKDISWNITETVEASSSKGNDTSMANKIIPKSYTDDTKRKSVDENHCKTNPINEKRKPIDVKTVEREKTAAKSTSENRNGTNPSNENRNKTKPIHEPRNDTKPINQNHNDTHAQRKDAAASLSFKSCDATETDVSEHDLEIIDNAKLVGDFVATILASGVAAYIEEESAGRGKWTKHQATVALEMAQAIMCVNSNDVNLAAKTIINAIDKAKDKDEIHSYGCCLQNSLCSCGHGRIENDTSNKISSVCVLL